MQYRIRNTVLLILFFFSMSFAQDYNPPFPRTIYQTPAGLAGGAIEHFFAQYDLVIHGGAGPVAYEANARIRALNPDILIFGTSRQGVWPGSFEPGCFIYRDAYGELTQTANPGDGVIHLTSTAGFMPSGNDVWGIIGENDWIKFAGVDGNTIYGIPTDPDAYYGINDVHDIGDSVKSTIRFVGFGMLQNITPYAPLVNGEEVWKVFVDARFHPNKQDFSYFDGVFYDAFRDWFWAGDIPGGADLDYNHINDFTEHGLNWFNAQWEDGIKNQLTYEHQKFSELHPGDPSVIVANTGAANYNYMLDYCEGMMWEGFMRFASDWNGMLYTNRLWEQQHDPAYVLIEDYDPERRIAYSKNKYSYMRYGLTTALMGGAWYGRTFGDYYYITFYYDEFDTNLGYPTSDPQEMPNGVYARFFDHGVAICNPTGYDKTVTASDLSALSGFSPNPTTGKYYHFLGGQRPEINNGQEFDSMVLTGWYEEPPKKIKGDGIILFREPDTVVSDIFVGNCFNNDTSPRSEKVYFEGWWGAIADHAGGSQPFDERNPCFSQWNQGEEGYGYHYTHAGDGSRTATYAPNIGVAGYYEISEWHGYMGRYPSEYQEATNVPFEIVTPDKKIRGIIDQTTNIGQWNRLAIVYLDATPPLDPAAPLTSGYPHLNTVTINNNADSYVIADAMRFRYLGTNIQVDEIPPNAPTNVKIYQE